VNVVTPSVSETVGCWIVSEFIDVPERELPGVGGKADAPSKGAEVRILDEFLDEPLSVESAAHGGLHSQPDQEAGGSGMALYNQAVAFLEQLIRKDGRSDLIAELARARGNQAVAVREVGEERAAAALVDQTIALYERLVLQEQRHELAHSLATAYDNKATMLLYAGNVREAVAVYDRTIAVLKPLVERNGRQELTDDLARARRQREFALTGAHEK
jgi:hypothetical protein